MMVPARSLRPNAPKPPSAPIGHLYIHVPFCARKCHYCAFYSETANASLIDQYVTALIRELELVAPDLRPRTVYFGGGTPSRLNARHFEQMFETLFREYAIDPDAEITLEANPDDVTNNFLKMLHVFPFNRLSMGVQSFD